MRVVVGLYITRCRLSTASSQDVLYSHGVLLLFQELHAMYIHYDDRHLEISTAH